MIVYVDSGNRIKDVNLTEDPALKEVYLDETVENFPFKDWSADKICCYKIQADDAGRITMITPYVDSKALPHIEEQGKKHEDKEQALAILLGEEEEE